MSVALYFFFIFLRFILLTLARPYLLLLLLPLSLSFLLSLCKWIKISPTSSFFLSSLSALLSVLTRQKRKREEMEIMMNWKRRAKKIRGRCHQGFSHKRERKKIIEGKFEISRFIVGACPSENNKKNRHSLAGSISDELLWGFEFGRRP